ncbi:MAG: DNA mismatch repair endonuclease MutL [Acholeplasmataceae bacterium]|nr:DNA mismatch repair endonuclease MutL [Acholeplasmataceae bacterium]
MGIIKKLDEHTTNLIAAGEVIERAASVVKELVENSIDAKATKILIQLVESGLTEIRVIDDGVGMDPIDAKLCVMPHATSKIQNESDLFNIHTLGFRGEALASIVAVSNFRLITSVDGSSGMMYSLKGGVPMSEGVIAHGKGTEIIVKNLFFNTPARLQNLQSPNVELSYITDYVTRVALCNPNISFTLINNDHIIMQTYGNNELLEVIASVISNDAAKNMISVFDNNGVYKINGYISNLSLTRSSKNYIYLFVNGRPVKSNNINNAIVKGYDTLLMVGKYPVCVLNIESDASIVDVNVHPTKAEVRFSDEKMLLEQITAMISKALKLQDLSIDMSTNEVFEKDNFQYNADVDSSEVDDEENDENEENDSYLEQVDEENQNEETTESEDDIISSFAMFEEDDEEPSEVSIEDEEEKETKNVENSFLQQKFTFDNDEVVDENYRPIDKLGKLNYIGQLFGTYILAQSENEFYVIDQHAAAERINYEKIIKELDKDEKIGYDLLIPFNIDFSMNDAMLVREHIDEIKEIGIDLSEFGSNTFVIRRIPVWIFRGKEQEFVEEIITHIIHDNKKTKKDFLNSLAKSLACKKSIKGNEYHSSLEIEYLLEDLRNTENPFTCPHGRPIIIKFTQNEIEKWFKRIV